MTDVHDSESRTQPGTPPRTRPGTPSRAATRTGGPRPGPGATGADGSSRPRSRADRLAARAERLREKEAQAAERRAGTPGRGRRGAVLVIAALSVVVVALAALLVVTWVRLDHRDSALARARAADAQRSSVLTAAKAWATRFGSYDYQHLTSDFAGASKYMTPSFAGSYTRTSQALAKTFVAYKTQVTASVPAAAVMTVGPTRATALVLLDQVIKSTQTTTPKINRNRLTVVLVRDKGRWLVSRSDAT